MWCNINLMIIATVCVPLINSTAVIHYLEKTYGCGEQLTLKCVITEKQCCSNETRVWRKNSELIFRNGVHLTKYSETINENEGYFALNINSLQQEDFEQVYDCRYGSMESAAIRLNKDYLYCFPCCYCALLCLGYATAGSIGGAVLVLFTYIFAYNFYSSKRCCKLPFFEQRDNFTRADCYKFEGKDYPKRKVRTAFLLAIPLFLIVRWTEIVVIPALVLGVNCTICIYELQEIVIVLGWYMFLFIPFYDMTLKYKNGETTIGTYCCQVFINWVFFIPPLVFFLSFFYERIKKRSTTQHEIHNKKEEDNEESQL